MVHMFQRRVSDLLDESANHFLRLSVSAGVEACVAGSDGSVGHEGRPCGRESNSGCVAVGCRAATSHVSARRIPTGGRKVWRPRSLVAVLLKAPVVSLARR